MAMSKSSNNYNIIQKTIDLSRYKSLYPSYLPYIDENGEYIGSGYDELELFTNYGHLVCDVLIPSNIASNINYQTDIYINIPTEGLVNINKKVYGDYYDISNYSEERIIYFYTLANETDFYSTDTLYYYAIRNESNGLQNIYRYDISMGAADEGTLLKFASFQTLVSWYRFFKEYYSLLYNIKCNGNLYKLSEKDGYEYQITDEIQNKFDRLGGEATYEWVQSILYPIYEVCPRDPANEDICNNPTNCGCIDLNYFPNRITWHDIENHKEYISTMLTNIEELTQKGDTLAACCLEEELKEKYGTMENVECIFDWLKNQTPPTIIDSETKSSSLNLQICITQNIDNLGEYSILAEDYNMGEYYRKDDYVVYGYDTYVSNKNIPSSSYDDCLRSMYFDENNWDLTVGKVDFEGSATTKTISGETESKLENFISNVREFDSLGNDTMAISLDELISQDGTILMLPYRIYNTCDLTKTDVPYVLEDTKYYEMFGNILTNLRIFLKDIEGNEINGTSYEFTLEDTENKDKIEELLGKIEESKTSEITSDGSINELLNDSHLYAEFQYTMGTTLRVVNENGTYHYTIPTKNINDGVKYKEVRIIEKESFAYCVTNLKTVVAYRYILSPIRTETIYNNTLNTALEYNLADFEYTISEEDYSTLNSQVVMLNYKFGTDSLQNVDSNVYVTRGISSAFDKLISLGGIKSFEALENYQNSSFNIINSNG